MASLPRRTLKLLLPCFAIFSASIILTIFISRVMNSNGAAVRVKPSLCGLYSLSDVQIDGASDIDLRAATHWHLAKGTDSARRAKAYASETYMNGSSLDNLRPIFRQRALPFVMSADAPCPFPNASRCSLGENAAFLVASGMIDSHQC